MSVYHKSSHPSGMNYSFISELKEKLRGPLPGRDAQLLMAPEMTVSKRLLEPSSDAILSSVLLLLYPWKGKLYTSFIRRTEYDGVHSGQISLPGGKHEDSDIDEIETALREAMEETGLPVSEVEVLGCLSRLYIYRSNYLVLPVVGYNTVKPEYIPDPLEVQEILDVDIDFLFKPESMVNKEVKIRHEAMINAPGFLVKDHFIWGATAMILSEFREIIRDIR